MEEQWNQALTILAACVTSCGLILFILVVLVNHKRRDLLQESKIKTLENESQILVLRTTLEIEEREKVRIFKNMHDQINPMLRLVVRRIELHKEQLENDQLTSGALADDVEILLRAVESIRSCTYDLVPSFMLEYGFFKSFEDLMIKLNTPGNIAASFQNTSAYLHDLPMSKQENLNAYRICLEIINNILQHSSCSSIHMKISNNNELLTIDLIHDGRGISNEEAEQLALSSKGQGLNSSNARALLINSKIDYLATEIYTGVKITIPIKNEYTH